MRKLSVKTLLEDNNFLRILSFAVAILCWLGVQLTQSPTSRNDIENVSVTLSAPADILADLGLSPIGAEENSVTVTLRGPRTEIGRLKPEDLQVVANISGVSEPRTYDLSLTLTNQDKLRDEKGIELERFQPSTIKVRFDRMVTKTFEIQPEVSGRVIAEGLMAEQEKITPNKVTITGPQADLDRIDKAVVAASFTEPLSRTYSAELPIQLLDAQGEALDTENSSMIMDSEQAQMVIRVLKVKTLPLVVNFTNKPLNFPLEDLQLLMSMTDDEITLAGPVDIMDNYQEVLLGYIDFKQLSLDNAEYVFNVELPSTQFSNINSVASVEVYFDTDSWFSAAFSTGNLQIENAPPGYTAELLTTSLSNIQLVGKQNIVDTLTADDIVVTVDMAVKEVTPGQQSYPVKISLPTKGLVWAVGEYDAIIEVTAK